MLELDPAPPICLAPDTPVREACRLLERKRIASILVCEEDTLVGIFTQRDVLYQSAAGALDLDEPLSTAMTAEPQTLTVDSQLSEALATMIERGFRQMPLVDGSGRPLGVLTSRIILRFVAAHYPEAVLNLPPHLHQVMTTPEGG